MKKLKYLAMILCAAMMASSCDNSIDDKEEEEITIENGENTSNDNQQANKPTSSVEGWTAEEVAKASTAANIESMKKVDKEIIMYCNLARMDGAKFWTTIAKPHIGNKSSDYITSLKTDLEATKNHDMLMPEKGLYESAKYHAEDMRKNDYFAHQSIDGTATFDRVARFYTKSGSRAENIAAGNSKPIDIVMQWLVDANTPSLGHRKSILSNDYKVVGVYTCEHPSWRWITVQDFGSIVIEPLK